MILNIIGKGGNEVNGIFSRETLGKAIFNLEDLDGKTVTLRVAKSEGRKLLFAVEGDNLYLIDQIKSKNEQPQR